MRTTGWGRDSRKASAVELAAVDASVRVEGIPRELPVVVSSTVDARFGPTAVLGIPAADETDREIAVRLGLDFDESAADDHALTDTAAVRFRMGDVPISRQRAWGTPMPIVYCDACGVVPVPLEQLPVRLPDGFVVRGEGNALLDDPDFVNCSCPRCEGPAKRETDTMDCHVDNAWTILPAAVPADARADSMFDHRGLEDWLPVDQLVQGGDTGSFSLDLRVVMKALRDEGTLAFIPDGEPYRAVVMHGMVTRNGRKMSKHLGNGVSPEELVGQVGADTVRLAALHAAAPQKSVNWSESMLQECGDFLSRLWRYASPRMEPRHGDEFDTADRLRRWLAASCDTATAKITRNIATVHTHLATRNLMRMLDQIEEFERRVIDRRGGLSTEDEAAIRVALVRLTQLLGPLAPHMAHELWSMSGESDLLADAGWPEPDLAPDNDGRARALVRT
jgi:leucyl-tRNA synthetase